MQNLRLVLPHGDGAWAVTAPGARRVSSTHAERYDAIAVARRTLQNNAGGVIEVRDEHGALLETHEVAPIRNRRVGDLKVR
jgi:hypothetical protein